MKWRKGCFPKKKGASGRRAPGIVCFLGGIVSFLLASCAGSTLVGYEGPEPPGAVAIVRSGAYATLVQCDESELGPSRLKVAVVPGEHVVRMGMRRQTLGNKFFYSNVVGSARFLAEAGRTYVVDVELVPVDKWLGLVASRYDWVGRVIDEETGEILAATGEPLPVRIETINVIRDFMVDPY